MSTAILEEKAPAPSGGAPPVVNDFSIHVATANGSGSMSSNNILMRSIFQMGIPVSGKNLFPSNIQGLPTWFTIRASKEGFIARRRDIAVLICMNPETAHEDVRTVAPGAAVIYEESLKLNTLRNDVHFYPVPFGKLVLELVHDGKLRRLVVNMIYVGVAAWLLDIDMAEVERAVAKQFKGKEKAVEINLNAIRGGFDWAQKNLTKADPFRLERMNATAGKIIIDGNSAAALGCMFAGVTVVTWYPITPSSSRSSSSSSSRSKDAPPMPQLSQITEIYASQLFWLAIVFLLLTGAVHSLSLFIAPVAQNVHVSGQPDCDDRHTVRRPSR